MSRSFLGACVLSLTLALPALAQPVANEGLANAIIGARQANAQQLKQFSWSSRTELVVDQKTEDIRIESVVFAQDGTVQRTLLNDEPARVSGGFLRRAIAKDKARESEKYMKELQSKLDQYTLPTPGKLLDFLAKAQVQPVTSAAGTTQLQVTGNNVLVQGDTFTMTVDGRTFLPIGVQITTIVEGDTVTATVTYRSLDKGPNHAQYITVQSPAKNMTVNIHNYDYTASN